MLQGGATAGRSCRGPGKEMPSVLSNILELELIFQCTDYSQHITLERKNFFGDQMGSGKGWNRLKKGR